MAASADFLKYFLCCLLALVFLGLAAAQANSNPNGSWSTTFIPLFLMDGLFALMSLADLINWRSALRVAFFVITKVVYEALLLSKLNGDLDWSYAGISLPLLLFVSALSLSIVKVIYHTIKEPTDFRRGRA